MIIDDDTLKQLLQINDELFQSCKWLNERRDPETSSRLAPLVDDRRAGTNYSKSSAGYLFRRKAYLQVTNLFDRAPTALLQKIDDLATEWSVVKNQTAGIVLVFMLNH
jgi:hypothetical protein